MQWAEINPARVLVIVPIYNEAAAVVEQTVASLMAVPYSVLIVDDGSQPPVSLPPKPGLSVVRHTSNLGQGAALQTGMVYARRSPMVDFVVHFDGDGQHPVAALANLLAPLALGRADVVFGSRFMRSEDRQQVPGPRRLVLQLGRIFNYFVTRIWMTDAHIGLRALHRRAFEKIDLRENRMAYATELLWQLRINKLRWEELPVRVTYSTYSRKKGQTSWNALRIAADILLRLIYR